MPRWIRERTLPVAESVSGEKRSTIDYDIARTGDKVENAHE